MSEPSGFHVPAVSVIVVNWNGKHLLPDCLDSLSRQTFADFEVVLVDNGSADGSVEFVAVKYPDVRIIALSENLGFCGGNNAGIRATRSEYVVLLNNDTEVEPDWLAELWAYMVAHPGTAASDSKVLYFDRRNILWGAGAEYSAAGTAACRGQGLPDGPDFMFPREVFGAVACSAIYRRAALEDVGLLDEDFFAGYEDVDWSFRARLRGYSIANVPSSRVYHKVSATHVHNSERFVYHGQRNVVAVFVKNMPAPLFYLYLPLHLFYGLGAAVYFVAIGRGRAYLRGRRDALLSLPHLLRKRRGVQAGRTVASWAIASRLDRSWFREKANKFRSSVAQA